ncbi:ZIP family metal transporter [Thiohalobacter sp. COW1]|uniref:Zinc transporter n=1 Tax=Thiohalobacter thiocyanaticus TaxID=585455 RepID=A0A1Z4VUC5_9GAMM|nr:MULTISPECIES: ZIP family metal transporter [Thiohalobacter]BAZ95002.1 zinc transporter [Thiohalobacter thiocyanaticus]BCO33084.1 ZIP family metal transporter [Thiohalobacter sp. COW1]
MPLLSWILLFCLLGGALSVIAAGAYLLFPERVRTALLPHLVSFAIGALLGAAFLALLPHALASPGIDDYHIISGTVLLGVLGFFLLEKLVLWRHCHEAHCEVHAVDEPEAHDHGHSPAAGTLILVGDAVHNLVDGVLIGAAFLTDIHLGIVTSLAVAAHEIPQEVGDFAILLNNGYSRLRAFVFNIISSLATLVGGVIAYVSLKQAEAALPFVLAIAASSFIYVAVADLIPGLHKRVHAAATAQQVVLIAAGVLVIYAAHATLH